jgi:titin
MGFIKRGVALATGIVIAAAHLFAISAPAQAATVTLGSGTSSNTFTTPAAPVIPWISSSQVLSFEYPGGVFNVGAPNIGSSQITIQAFKNGALDTSFNTTGSATFNSQFVTSNRSNLSMTTYANGAKWAILDENANANAGYNYLYLGTFAGGYQSTITLPTTASNATTCTNKLEAISAGVYTSYSGSTKLVPNTGFASPLLMITCAAFLSRNGAPYTTKVNFLVNYSGGSIIGTPASFTAFGGNASAGPLGYLNNSTSKTMTNFGVSVNPAATGSQIALTFLDAVTDELSYDNPIAYDTTNYTDFFVTRVTASGTITTVASAWGGVSTYGRKGTVYLAPRNNGTVYALQHATDGTNVAARLLKFSNTGSAYSATYLTGHSLTEMINRIVTMPYQGHKLKFASVGDGSVSDYFELNGSTAVLSKVASFTPSGGFGAVPWQIADSADGVDFYVRNTSTEMMRVTASTAPQAPVAPATPTVARGDGSVAVTWVAPANGGAAITGYSLEYSSNSGSTWTNWSSAISSSATTETVTGLTNGTAYVFRVAATNSIGTSAWSSSSASTSPAALPSAPTLSALTAGANNVALTWNAPSSTGGFAITDYRIEFSSNGGSSWSTFAHTASAATSISVTGLTNGTSYVFKVSAVTSIGTGAASAISAAQLVAAAPGQPNAPTIANGNAQATVTWVAPAENGCAITAYRVDYSSNAGSTWNTFTSSAAGTSHVVTGLTNGTAYVFRVAATNCMGFGAASAASSSVTPNQTPTAATGLSVVGAGSSTVTLNWTAVVSTPSVTDYLVQYSTDGGSTWVTVNDGVSASAGATVSGLTVGQNYSFRVTAVNSIGQGTSSSATASIAAGTVPSALASAPSVTATPGQVAMSWSLPSNGGSPLTAAEVQYSLNGGVSWLNYTGSVDLTGSVAISGLTAGQAYVFRARTTNFFGQSAWSAASSSVTFLAATAPATITSVTSTPGSSVGTVDLSWTAPAANGSPITDYLIEYSSDGGVTWQTFTHPASTATSISVTGITAGTQYQFRVKALNAVGSATASASTTPVAAATTSAIGGSEATKFIASLKPGGKVNVTDGKLTIDGENMDKVTKVLMNSVEAPIIFRTSIALTVQIPATVIGWVDVEFVTDSSKILFQNFVYVNNNKNQIAKLGIGYAKVMTKVSTSIFKTNSTVRLAKQTPNFALANSVTCVGYVGKGMTQREALARARHTCEQLTLRYPRLSVQLATTKSILRAHVLVLFKY